MTLVDRVEAAKEQSSSLGEEKRKKMAEYRLFRQRMIEAGIDVEGRFTIPLMGRIGHGYTATVDRQQKAKKFDQY